MSGMDPTAGIVHGRPHGGVAVLWKSSLNGVVSPVTTNHRRVSAVNLSLKPNVTLLVICVYLPCDTQKIHTDHEEFIDVLDYIEQLLYKDSYIICGDFNTSFERNNAHTEYLNGFMSRNNLI